jgi:beta-xylosidase
MHDEIGVRTVRAHAIFHDDTHVFGASGYDFSVVDTIYDKLLAIGLRPVVELGFMPRELASIRRRRSSSTARSSRRRRRTTRGTTWSAHWSSISSTGTAWTRC